MRKQQAQPHDVDENQKLSYRLYNHDRDELLYMQCWHEVRCCPDEGGGSLGRRHDVTQLRTAQPKHALAIINHRSNASFLT